MRHDILTPDCLGLYVLSNLLHAKYEKEKRMHRERILIGMEDLLAWSGQSYHVIVRLQERHIFDSKQFQHDYPDLHEEYLKVSTSKLLTVAGPPAPMPTEEIPDSKRPLGRPSKGYVRSLISTHLGPEEELVG